MSKETSLAKKETNINTIEEVPVNREELAAFYTAMIMAQKEAFTAINNSMIEILKLQDAKLENMAAMQKELLDKTSTAIADGFGSIDNSLKICACGLNNTINNMGITSVASKIDELTNVLDKKSFSNILTISKANNSTDLFSATKSAKDCDEWIRKAKAAVTNLCYKTGVNRATAYNNIYKSMEKDGYNIYALYEKNCKSLNINSYIKLCSLSDVLRLSFEKRLNAIYTSYKKNNKSRPRSIEAQLQPDCVKKLISEFYGYKCGTTAGTNAAKVFNILSTEYDVDLDSLVIDAKKRYGYKTVSTSYAISLNRDAMSKLRAVVKKYGVKA